MRWRAILRAATLSALLVTPATGAAAEPVRSSTLSRWSAALFGLVEAGWKGLPSISASSEAPADPEGLNSSAHEPNPDGAQNGEGGPGWDPDGLTVSTDSDFGSGGAGSS